jgi:uncharacterized protein YkwD
VRKFWWLLFGLLAIVAPARADDDMAAMISEYRQTHGLPPVKTDERLTRIAEQQARAMADKDILDHGAAGPFATRIGTVAARGAGENIARGASTWAETLRIWEGSPGHDANLRLQGATHVGVAMARNGKRTYWAMEIADESPPARGRHHVQEAGGIALPEFLQRFFQ